MEESNNTIFYNIWLQYNSLRSKYKPQKIRSYNKENQLIHEMSADDLGHLLYKAYKNKIDRRGWGFLIGLSKKYHYNIQHDEILSLSERQLKYLQRLSA